jgi:anaerobic magnesium-protoporphyrin IX monomethyl ester cyclase
MPTTSVHSLLKFSPSFFKQSAIHSRSFMTKRLGRSNLKICFVHTPMCSVENEAKKSFWEAFDRRYYMVHPHSKPVDASIWELPHWIPWLAGVLRDEGYEDTMAMPINPMVSIESGIDTEIFYKQIQENPADVYLHSPMTANLHLANDISDLIKKVYPKAINIYGGVVATPLANEIAKHSSIDFVIVERGERALPDLLRSLEGHLSIDKVGHLVYHDQNQVIRTSPKYPAVKPSELSFPRHDIFASSIGEKLRYIRLVHGLGCPFKCHFCTIGTIGRPTEFFPIERVMAELDAYRSHYGKNHIIYFGDETFTINSKKTKELCNALAKRGDVVYDAQTRLMSMSNAHLLSDLYRSGCRWLEVGLETVDQETSNQFKQRTNLSKLREILERARDSGLPVCSYMIHGLPNQTTDDMLRSADMVAELLNAGLLHATYYNMLVPYPGTSMYNHPEQFDMTLETRETKFYNEDSLPVYRTKHASSQKIYDAFIQATETLAEAMSGKPYLGEVLSDEIETACGRSLVHI